MTEKLYYSDARLHEFEALVVACARAGERWAVELDRSAFFPVGGGQPADTGRIGEARVFDVREEGERILHFTDRALPVGARVRCALDFAQRFARMQNHSGEHVVSGHAHRLFGLENVGFHMGEKCMTIDFSAELSGEQLEQLELAANRTVWDNVPVRAFFPEPEALAALDYRSKLALTENVRLVEIEGVDLCACCAPHVSRTGEIGAVKILSAERHRGGMRIELICGADALEDYRRRQADAAEISRMLSVPRDQIAPAVTRQLREQERQKERIAALSMELARRMAESMEPTEGNLWVFDSLLDEIALRELVNRMTERCALAAVFSGSDGEGYRYIIGSRRVDLRAHAREINAAVNGRGGGSSTMLQGRAAASAEQLAHTLEALRF